MSTPCQRLQPLLRTTHLGRTCHFHTNTVSTNLDATVAAQQGATHGTIIVADSQSGGRGRMSRSWHSPPDCNLYLSIILRPEVEISTVPSLPLLVGLAVVETLHNIAPSAKAGFKWPNDLLLNNRKLCGILCEMQMQGEAVAHVVAGIGLNLNLSIDHLPPELHERAASLYLATNTRYSRTSTLAAILNHLEPLYQSWQQHGLEPLLLRLNRYDLLLGHNITVQHAGKPVSGTAAGIAPDGALLLQHNHEIIRLYSGETHIGAAFKP